MTEDQFLLYWKLLCDRHRLTPAAPLTRIYAVTVMGEGIGAEEWGRAVGASIRFDDFFPSIQKLIDYARPSFKVQALGEWDACMERVKAGEAATLPGAVRTLMNRVTNGVPLGQIDNDRLPWVKREFLERYEGELRAQAQAATPALLPAAPRRELAS